MEARSASGMLHRPDGSVIPYCVPMSRCWVALALLLASLLLLASCSRISGPSAQVFDQIEWDKSIEVSDIHQPPAYDAVSFNVRSSSGAFDPTAQVRFPAGWRLEGTNPENVITDDTRRTEAGNRWEFDGRDSVSGRGCAVTFQRPDRDVSKAIGIVSCEM